MNINMTKWPARCPLFVSNTRAHQTLCELSRSRPRLICRSPAGAFRPGQMSKAPEACRRPLCATTHDLAAPRPRQPFKFKSAAATSDCPELGAASSRPSARRLMRLACVIICASGAGTRTSPPSWSDEKSHWPNPARVAGICWRSSCPSARLISARTRRSTVPLEPPTRPSAGPASRLAPVAASETEPPTSERNDLWPVSLRAGRACLDYLRDCHH